jgi:ribosomal protein S18 acetylase RimI-like enzyme
MFELEREPFATSVLRDGRAVMIRPLDEVDRPALLAFGRALPHGDLLYLEDDLASPELVERLVNAHFAENWRQFVAATGDLIIGYAAVRRLPGWSSHVADIGLIVSAGWRRLGVGTALAQTIFDAARELQAAKLIVEMLEEQCAGRAIFERLGFGVEGTFVKHARDRYDQRHNLIVMAYNVP